MKDINMIKNDLKEIQKYFNPEKSTYKVFNELIKHNYTSEEMINVLSKIRGVHKYPDKVKTEFLDIINSLNILKDYEERQRIAKEKEEEKIKQQAKTEELQDIIDNLEKAKQDKKEEQKNSPVTNNTPQIIPNVKEEVKEKVAPIKEKIEPVKEKVVSPFEELKDIEMPEEDGRLMFIILILLVVISLVVIGLFILLY